jgi:hypothetical protein
MDKATTDSTITMLLLFGAAVPSFGGLLLLFLAGRLLGQLRLFVWWCCLGDAVSSEQFVGATAREQEISSWNRSYSKYMM